MAALIAILIVYLILPFFSSLANRPLSLTQITDLLSVSVVLVIIIAIGFLAGIYPAFFISSFAPLSVLKGKLKGSKSGARLRNGLVIMQFAISITLISATLIVFDQMNYLLNKSLGFEQENVLVIDHVDNLWQDPNTGIDKLEIFKNEVNRLKEVSSSAFTSYLPGGFVGDFVARIPGADQKESMVMRQMVFGEGFIETMNMELKEGRFFDHSFSDSLSIVLNESAVNKLGLSDPIGKKTPRNSSRSKSKRVHHCGSSQGFSFPVLTC